MGRPTERIEQIEHEKIVDKFISAKEQVNALTKINRELSELILDTMQHIKIAAVLLSEACDETIECVNIIEDAENASRHLTSDHFEG